MAERDTSRVPSHPPPPDAMNAMGPGCGLADSTSRVVFVNMLTGVPRRETVAVPGRERSP